MPAAEPAAGVTRVGDSLRFEGALVREVVAGVWKQALSLLPGATTFDLAGVPRVDSAGVALLAELAARGHDAMLVEGAPDGLAELRAAYRMTQPLAFAH